MTKINDYTEVWESFLDLVEKHEEIDPPILAGLLASFVARMTFDCAPNIEEAKDVLNTGIQQGLKWHLEDKGHNHD